MGNCEEGSDRSCKKVLWILIIEANRAEEWELGGEIVVVDYTHETRTFWHNCYGIW
jgi:hypothetical protein